MPAKPICYIPPFQIASQAISKHIYKKMKRLSSRAIGLHHEMGLNRVMKLGFNTKPKIELLDSIVERSKPIRETQL